MRVVHADDFVEEGGDLAVDAVDFLGQANAEVTATQRAKRADELTAINEVPLGLDVHSTLRVAYLPPPGLQQSGPPAAQVIHNNR